MASPAFLIATFMPAICDDILFTIAAPAASSPALFNLLPEDNLVMVLTEQGAVVVLDADSQTHKELASMQMLNGKTWNHPVFIGDRLYLRNSEEAACNVLPMKDRP